MRHGFSLVELSIVLVILGLLTGGILAGQSLIRASELRAVSTEYSRYTTAIGSFRDKYFAVPGDMTNATKFWGTAAACPGTNATPSTTAATCDGNGNGRIDIVSTNSNEVFRFWQHLANAGLTEGSYSGVSNNAAPATADARLGWNVPPSKLSNGGWSPQWLGTPLISSTGGFFEGDYANTFYFGGTAIASNLTGTPILKAEEAWNIDTKSDDGKPGTGSVLSWEVNIACHDATPSTSVAIAATAAYRLSDTTQGCSLLFKTGY